MIHTNIQLVGTYGDGWREDILALLKGASFGDRHAGDADTDAGHEPNADTFLAVVQHPVAALAAALEASPGTELSAWIDDWISRGQQLMRLLQRNPARCIFVRMDEAVADPRALAAALEARFGVQTAAADVAQPRRALDPVALAIARVALFRQAAFWALAAELDAACLALMSDVPVLLAQEGRPHALHADLDTAWDGYVRVQRDLRADRSRHEAQQAASTLALELLEEDLARSRDRQDATDAELEAARQAQAAEQDTARQLLETERAAARRAAAAGTAERDAAQRRLAETEEENRQLLLDLHEVQDLLERELGTGRAREARVEALDGALRLNGAGELLIEDVQFVGSRDDAPYRELDIRLAGVRASDDLSSGHDIRLVEHRGHPGLVVFAAPDAPSLFSAWRETGKEADRSFMLLVPNDASGAQLLNQLPRADYHRLVRLLENVQRALEASPAHARWLAVVRRLRVEVLERSDRLRYDDLQISPVAETPSVLNVDFLAVEFGARQWARLNVRWQPGDVHPLELRLSDVPGDMPPLKGWMDLAAADDTLSSWTVPLANAAGGSEGLDAWRRLDPTDRELLVAVLDAIPAASLQAIDKGLVDASENQRLLEASHDLLRRVPVEAPPIPGRLSRLRRFLSRARRPARRDAAAGAFR